jgi:homogentisate 1,2-dioxygenase
MVHTPGVVRWAVNGYAFKRDRANLRRIFTDGYGLPDKAVHALLTGEAPHTVEDETVIFTYPKEK